METSILAQANKVTKLSESSYEIELNNFLLDFEPIETNPLKVGDTITYDKYNGEHLTITNVDGNNVTVSVPDNKDISYFMIKGIRLFNL